MDFKGAIFESASELKNILHHRSDLSALEGTLTTLLKQMNAALLVENVEDAEFSRLAGVVFKFFEGSQSATTDFLKLWDISLRINSDSSMALILLRTFSLLFRVLKRRQAFVPFASKLAKDSYTQQTKFINRCLSASSVALSVCALDFLVAMASIDYSCTEFVFESVDLTMKCFSGFVMNRRKVIMDPGTGVYGDLRGSFIGLFSAWLSFGSYDIKLACLKMNQFMSPIVSGLFGDSPDAVLSFLNMIDKAILENEQNSKNITVSFFTQNNTVNFMKLLEYENSTIQFKTFEILTKISSRQSASNIIFKVEKLSADESACLRNKVLQNIVNNLKIFDSIQQLQLAIKILEECPDLVNPFFRSYKFLFEPEVSIKWLTLFSFLGKVADIRPVQEIEIEKVPSLEYLLAPICPPRAALTRSLLNDSAIVKLYSLQALVSILRRTFWCIEIIEKELESCLKASLEIAEMSRKVELLEESRSKTISSAQKLIPDIQTLQSLLNILLSDKEIKSDGDLEGQLLPQDWRNQLISLCLDSLQYYARLFISQEDSLGQAQFEDPVKFVSVLLNSDSCLSESLELSILKFSAVFPRIVIGSNEHWSDFFSFICKTMTQSPSQEKMSLAKRIFERALYSTGIFVTNPDEVSAISFCLQNYPNLFSNLLKDLSQFQINSDLLIFDRVIAKKGIEISPLLSKWLELEISDEMYNLGQRVLDHLIEQSERKRVCEETEKCKRVKLSEPVGELKSNSDHELSEPDSNDSSDDSSSSDDSDDDLRQERRSLKVLEKRVDFELPDPEVVDPAILFSQLLNNLDRDRMHNFILNFPSERRLVPPAQRRRVNENMLKDLLYGSEDFLLFCNWLGVLTNFVSTVPRDKFDGYTLVRSNLLGAVVVGMSSEDNSMRRICGHLLASIHDAIRPAASIQVDGDTGTLISSPADKVKQVYSLLCQLRRSIKYDDTQGTQKASLGFFKLSGVTALYYAEAISVMSHPDHHMFSPIGTTIHTGAFLSLSGVPLFDNLVRQVDDQEGEGIVERMTFIKQLQWLLKIIQFGCKSRSDFELGGPLHKSRVLETILSLFTMFIATIGKNQESERVSMSILKTLNHLKSIDGVNEVLKKEFGQDRWYEMLNDVILKAKTPLNKNRLEQIEGLI